jgi:hypothetical protein
MLIIKIFCSASLILLIGCASSGQISGSIRIIEENQDKKYTHIKTPIFKRDATILKDTINEFNRYPIAHAIKQYILSLTDVQEYENILEGKFVPDNKNNNDETFVSRFKKYNRQYSGFIDKLGDTVLVVCFLEFAHKKEANKFFYDWKYQNSFFGSVLYLHKKSPSIFIYSYNKGTNELKPYRVEAQAP